MPGVLLHDIRAGKSCKKRHKKSAPEHGEISESARKCEQKKEFLYTIRAGEEIIKNLQKLTLKKEFMNTTQARGSIKTFWTP